MVKPHNFVWLKSIAAFYIYQNVKALSSQHLKHDRSIYKFDQVTAHSK